MNTSITRLAAGISALSVLASCSDLVFGDRFLGQQPESSGATTEEMFSTNENAEKVLTNAYKGLIYGISAGNEDRLGGNVLESLTDLCHSFRDNAADGPKTLYYNGMLSPGTITDNAMYDFGKLSDWSTIRYAWLYLENIDKVPDISGELKAQRVGEAKTLIALSYFRMLRYVGGVTWIDRAVSPNDDMNFTRLTFAQTVDNIVRLLDEAIPGMVWKQDEQNDGRMSRAGAMALKFQVLQWAASPTFNSNTKWHPQADEYTCYGNYDESRWTAAAAAGKAFFDAVKTYGQYSLIQPEEETHRARRLAYRKAYYDRGGSEILISIRKGYGADVHASFIRQTLWVGPTLNYVDLFPWENGDEFPADFDWENPPRQPFFNYDASKGMVPTRDPRLYENVACPGDLFKDGTPAPVYTNHPQYKPGTGFMIMKWSLNEASDRANRPVQWPYLRLSEMMLGYAEVLAEVNGGPTPEAYSLVNRVRARVGLPELTPDLPKDLFLEKVFNERAMELGFEEVRWFDMVRRDMKKDFTKPLYGIRTEANAINNPTAYFFKKITLVNPRFWTSAEPSSMDTKWYLSPIPQDEINKQYGMTQNPGWTTK